MKQRTSLIYIKKKSSEQNLRHLGLKIIEWLGSMDMMHQLNKAVKMDKITKTVLSSLVHSNALGRSYLFAMSIHLERRCLQMRAEREGIHRSRSLRISATDSSTNPLKKYTPWFSTWGYNAFRKDRYGIRKILTT